MRPLRWLVTLPSLSLRGSPPPDDGEELVEYVVAVEGYGSPGEVLDGDLPRLDKATELDPQGSTLCELDPSLVPGHAVDCD